MKRCTTKQMIASFLLLPFLVSGVYSSDSPIKCKKCQGGDSTWQENADGANPEEDGCGLCKKDGTQSWSRVVGKCVDGSKDDTCTQGSFSQRKEREVTSVEITDPVEIKRCKDQKVKDDKESEDSLWWCRGRGVAICGTACGLGQPAKWKECMVICGGLYEVACELDKSNRDLENYCKLQDCLRECETGAFSFGNYKTGCFR